MSLYSKKLHIKKPNGVVQTANLYTDKSDVGNNYLTFRDGGNTVFSILDINGDIDCKISKNNINYKIKKENVVNVIPTRKLLMTNFNLTIPDGVTVLKMNGDYPNYNEWSRYIKVVPNRTYSFLGKLSDFATDEGYNEKCYAIQDTVTSRAAIISYLSVNDQGKVSAYGGEIDVVLYPIKLNDFDGYVPVCFEYSNEINKTTTIHADLT